MYTVQSRITGFGWRYEINFPRRHFSCFVLFVPSRLPTPFWITFRIKTALEIHPLSLLACNKSFGYGYWSTHPPTLFASSLHEIPDAREETQVSSKLHKRLSRWPLSPDSVKNASQRCHIYKLQSDNSFQVFLSANHIPQDFS